MKTFNSDYGTNGQKPEVPAAQQSLPGARTAPVESSSQMETKSVLILFNELKGDIAKWEKKFSQSQEESIKIPDDVVRKADLDEAVRAIKETVAIPEPKAPAVYISPLKVFEKTELDKMIAAAVKDGNKDMVDAVKKSASSDNICQTILSKLTAKGNIDNLWKKLRISLYFNMGFLGIIFGLTWWHDSKSERLSHLERVEWLYRWTRFKQKDSEEFQSFERTVLYATDEELDSIKEKIFNREADGPKFHSITSCLLTTGTLSRRKKMANIRLTMKVYLPLKRKTKLRRLRCLTSRSQK